MSRVSWRISVADHLSDHTKGAPDHMLLSPIGPSGANGSVAVLVAVGDVDDGPLALVPSDMASESGDRHRCQIDAAFCRQYAKQDDYEALASDP